MAEKRVQETHGSLDRLQSDDLTDATLVTFDGDDDMQNPRNWSKSYKWMVVLVISGISLASNLTVLVCAPATTQMMHELHSDNELDATLTVSIWNVGAAVSNLFSGPLSEVYGRLPVYTISNIMCLVMLAIQTQSRSMAMAIVFRCLNGLCLASMSLNPSIVGDLFIVEERGRAQSLLSLMPLLGPVVGPIAGGWIAQVKGWRWTFWFAFFVLAFFSAAFSLIYRETYEISILRRKAHRLRKQNPHMQFFGEQDRNLSTFDIARKAFLRPLKIFRVPIFLIVVGPSCILTGYVYLIATNIAQVMEETYLFSEGAAGLSFLGIAGGMAAGSLLCSFILDGYTKKMKELHDGVIKPEWRLPPMTLGFIISPIGLCIYGWTAQYHVQYIVPIVATALCGFATYLIQLPVATYFVDVFGIYRASAMSALMLSRNVVSTALPLAGPALYNKIGLGWGNSVLAFIALSLAPIPLFLLKYGEQIRTRSKLETWS